jgi:hypothetical protein
MPIATNGTHGPATARGLKILVSGARVRQYLRCRVGQIGLNSPSVPFQPQSYCPPFCPSVRNNNKAPKAAEQDNDWGLKCLGFVGRFRLQFRYSCDSKSGGVHLREGSSPSSGTTLILFTRFVSSKFISHSDPVDRSREFMDSTIEDWAARDAHRLVS